MKNESYGVIEVFTDWDDAVMWAEATIREKAKEGWELSQGSGVQYVNNQWRVGLGFDKEGGVNPDLAEGIETLIEGDTIG